MKKLLLFFALIASLCGCTGNVNITAEDLMANMKKAYQELDTFHETSSVNILRDTNKKVETSVTTEFSFKRPNLYVIKNTTGKANATIISDGKELSVESSESKEPHRVPASRTVSELYQRLTSRSLVNPERMITEFYLLDGRLPSEPFATAEVSKKLAKVEGKDCYVLNISAKSGDRQAVYVDKDSFMIRKNVISIVKPVLPKRSGMPTPQSAPSEDASTAVKSAQEAAAPLFTSDETMGVVETNPQLDPAIFKVKGRQLPLFPGKRESGKPVKTNALKGEMAPDFELKDENGKVESVSASKGKTVVLFFWDPLYKPSFSEITELQEIYAKASADKNLQIFAISDDKSEMRAGTFKKTGASFPGLYDEDGKVSSIYGVDVVPYTIIIDKDGKVSETFSGRQPREVIIKALKNRGIKV